MNEVRRQQLGEFGRFLDEQIAWFEEKIHADCINDRVMASEINAAFLQTDDDRVSLLVHDAIKQFSSTGEWPELDDRAYQNLQRRAWTACQAIAFALNPAADVKTREAIERRIPKRSDQFATWAFIESWAIGGKAMLTPTANKFSG